ncbi:FAD-dependent oxidoreductase [Streptomyces broussonetiae]|uniref:FAD-dependent oxidoreductase n=1 Tax=Streptomyces broussonetiae TaxID=2686304 RepID=UPI002D80B3A5|nr:FAD-dependent oxidoreductase [Streptomyces broussonetiae]
MGQAFPARRSGSTVTWSAGPLSGCAPCLPRRAFGHRIGALVAELHSDHGTRQRRGVPVRRLRAAHGRVTAAELGDGTTWPAVVVLALGATPATDWLTDSGLPLGDGVERDAYCQAAPGIYAAGDLASWHTPPRTSAPACDSSTA